MIDWRAWRLKRLVKNSEHEEKGGGTSTKAQEHCLEIILNETAEIFSNRATDQ